MYYSYVENEYIATSFSPARMDLAVKLLSCQVKTHVSCDQGTCQLSSRLDPKHHPKVNFTKTMMQVEI